MADARKKREDQQKNAVSKEERQSRMEQSRELADLRRSMAASSAAAGKNTVALEKGAAAQKKVMAATTAAAKIAKIDTSGSASAKAIQSELSKITDAMTTASASEFKILKAKAEFVTSQVKNVTDEDREATALMAKHAETAIAEIEKSTPKFIEKSLKGVGKSTLGFLDKSIGRNLLNSGLKLFGQTSLDERKDLKKHRRDTATAQAKALADDFAAKKVALDQQIAKQDEVGEAQISAVEGGEVDSPAGGDAVGPAPASGEGGESGGDSSDLGGHLEEIKVWSELNAEASEKINTNIMDGLGVRSPGYLSDVLAFFQGDKLSRIEDKREQQSRDDAQLDALEDIADKDDASGTAVVEAKGAGGGGLFGGIVKGFKGLLDLLKGIGSFIKDLIVGLFDMIAKVMKSIGEGIGGLLKGIAKGLNAFKKNSLIGAAAMVIVAGALWIMSKALQNFSQGVSWKGVAIGLVSLAALAIITRLMTGSIGGALAIVMISGAMWILAEAMIKFTSVTWKAVAIGLVTMIALGAIAVVLGVFSPLALLGAAAMVGIAAAMLILGTALIAIATAMDMAIPFFETIGGLIVGVIGAVGDLIEGIIGKVVDGLLKIAALDPAQLVLVGAAIVIIGGAITALGLALMAGGVFAAIGEFFSWLSGAESPVEVLYHLAELAVPLGMAAESILQIVEGLNQVAKIGEMDVSDTVGEAIEELNDAIEEMDEAMIDRKIKKLGELATAISMSGKPKAESGGIFGAISGAVSGLFNSSDAEKRVEELNKDLAFKKSQTASYEDQLARSQGEHQWNRRGSTGKRQARTQEFFSGKAEEGHIAINELSEELLALRQLIAENADLVAQAVEPQPAPVIINSPTHVDNSSNPAFIAPQNSANPRSGGQSSSPDIDDL